MIVVYCCGVIVSSIMKTESERKENATKYSGVVSEISDMSNMSEYDLIIEENEVQEVGQENEIVVDENEVDLLARAIYNECGILGDEAMYLCGCVIINRINSDLFPNTLYNVLYQKGQYQITTNGMINRPANDSAYTIARELLTNGSTIPQSVLFQSQFRQGSYTYKIIGNTYFCGL